LIDGKEGMHLEFLLGVSAGLHNFSTATIIPRIAVLPLTASDRCIIAFLLVVVAGSEQLFICAWLKPSDRRVRCED
jgi:hypothetical protein